VDGTFSNSATAGDYLFAEVVFTKDAVGIFLHEYEKSAPMIGIIGEAKIMLKNSNNEVLKLTTENKWNDSGGISISDFHYEGIAALNEYDYTNLKKFIKKSTGEIKVVINDEYSSSYKFTIQTTGFTEEYSLL
jgi:hypothetical protein